MIHLLWCTIRPTVFNRIHPVWMNNASTSKDIKTYVCVNTEIDKSQILEYNSKLDVKISDKSDKIGVCYPSFILSKSLEGKNDDIVVFASDDFLPPKNWDIYLQNKLKNKTGCLMVRDGYQLPDSSNMQYPAITIPIMTFDCLIKLNKIIYHPAYNHMYSDCELYLNLKDLNLLIDDRIQDTTVFEHHHYAAGKRMPDVADQSYNSKWKDDEIQWNERRNLPVSERLICNNK